MKHKPCLNCGHSVYERYCSNCGQKADTHRIGWHYLWHDLPHSIFHLDKGFFYTAKELTLRPGKAVREFLDGKRIRHFRPLAYVLILSVIMSLGIFGEFTTTSPGTADSGVSLDSGVGEFTVSGTLINKALSQYYGILTILCLPFYAFIAWLFYRRERNFVEIMTAFMFTYGHTIWFGLMLIATLYVESEALTLFMFWSWFIISVLYILWTGTTIFTRFHVMWRFLISIIIFIWGFIVSGIALIMLLYVYSYLAGQ